MRLDEGQDDGDTPLAPDGSDSSAIDAGPAGDAANDAGPDDAGAGLEPLCFPPDAVETYGAHYALEGTQKFALLEVLGADILGSGARFVAIGGWAVLGERPDGGDERWAVAVMRRFFPEEGLSDTQILDVEWPGGGGDYELLDVWGAQFDSRIRLADSSPVDVVALACDGSKCALLGADSDSGEPLRALTGFEMEAAPSLNGVVLRRDAMTGDETGTSYDHRWDPVTNARIVCKQPFADSQGIEAIGNTQITCGMGDGVFILTQSGVLAALAPWFCAP